MGELLAVKESDSVRSRDGNVLVSCKEIHWTDADVGAVAPGTSASTFGRLSPGGRLRLVVSPELQYEILLLSISEEREEVNVEVERVQKPTARVTDAESHTSCVSYLKEIAQEHLGGVRIVLRWEHANLLQICRPRFLFWRDVIFEFTKSDHFGEHLFKDGRWSDLVVRVYDARYLKAGQAIAGEYAQKTDRKVAVVKEF